MLGPLERATETEMQPNLVARDGELEKELEKMRLLVARVRGRVEALPGNVAANLWSIRGGNAQSGGLSTFYSGPRPNVSGYNPMHKEGAIILGIGGDNSKGSAGTFYEGVMTSGYPSNATENAVQANIVAAGYSSAPVGPTPGSRVSIQATTACCAADYLKHDDSDANVGISSITSSSSSTAKADATWIVHRGLADSSCVSFESANAPGEYLRHYNFELYLNSNDGSSQFAQDATFCSQTGNSGQGVSFGSLNYPTSTSVTSTTRPTSPATAARTHGTPAHCGPTTPVGSWPPPGADDVRVSATPRLLGRCGGAGVACAAPRGAWSRRKVTVDTYQANTYGSASRTGSTNGAGDHWQRTRNTYIALNLLSRLYRTGSHGGHVNIGEIAKRANVSRSTVSYALSGKRPVAEATRQKIQQVIAELGYRPNASARALANGRTRTLGVVFPPAGPHYTGMQLDFLGSLVEAAAALDHDVLMSASAMDGDQSFQRLLGERRVDGAILMEIRLTDDRVDHLTRIGFPFVTIGRTASPRTLAGWRWTTARWSPRASITSPTSDTAGSHWSTGPIGCCGSATSPRTVAWRASTAPSPPEVSPGGTTRATTTPRPATRASSRSCATTPRPPHSSHSTRRRWVACTGDWLSAGRTVPGDFSVTGVALTHWAETVTPQLTAADVPATQLGQLAVELLVERLADPSKPSRHHLLAPPISLRSSTGPAPAAF